MPKEFILREAYGHDYVLYLIHEGESKNEIVASILGIWDDSDINMRQIKSKQVVSRENTNLKKMFLSVKLKC